MKSRRMLGTRLPVAVCLVLTAVVSLRSEASHSETLADRQWIAQAGNGTGGSAPIIEDFNVQSVLFHPLRFPRTDGRPRPTMTRYLAFGTIRAASPQNVVLSQLAVARSEDGLRWEPPEPATIRDPDGVDAPFLLNEPDGYFDVTYTPDISGVAGVPSFAQLRIHYRIQNGNPDLVSSMHVAVSEDARTWINDRAVAQAEGAPLITGTAGTFNARTHGPTEVVYQTGGLFDLDCATKDPDGPNQPRTPSPWNCRWVMLYNTSDGTKQFIGIAGSPDGALFSGSPAPILSPGTADTWDDNAVAIAKIRIRPNPASALVPLYDLYYAGGRAGAACVGNASPCWSLGTAISTGGLAFAKTTGNPVAPRELLDIFSADGPSTLLHPVIVDDAGQNGDSHARIYFTRITNGPAGGLPDRDVFLAYTSPAPSAEPQIRIAAPVGPFVGSPDTPVDLWLTDTLGASTGVDLRTLALKLDGITLPGGWLVDYPHLVTSLRNPSSHVFIPGGFQGLADGTHVFEVSVEDFEGNISTASSSFVVDSSAPNTKVTPPPSPVLGFPLGGPRFSGETIETDGTAIAGVRVEISNPLGQTARYEVLERLTTKVNSRQWGWTWIASSGDPFFLVPGNYTFSFIAGDIAKNEETPDAENTVTILVV